MVEGVDGYNDVAWTSAGEITKGQDINITLTPTVINAKDVSFLTYKDGEPSTIVEGVSLKIENTVTTDTFDVVTGVNGTALQNLPYGEYSYTASKAGYEDATGTFTVDEINPVIPTGTVQIEMTSKLFTVSATLQDASTRLDLTTTGTVELVLIQRTQLLMVSLLTTLQRHLQLHSYC